MTRGKLGRRPPRKGLVLPTLRSLAPELAAPRPVVDWSLSVAGWGTWANLQIGDCTFAAAANARSQFGVYNGTEPAITDAEVIAAYSASTGYQPGKPETDQGAIETDVLAHWMTAGMTLGGRLDRIDGYAAVNPGDITLVRQAIDLYGGVMVGADLPISFEEQEPWGTLSVVPGPGGARGGLGGHEMWANGGTVDTVQFICWGTKVRAPWEWFLAYVDDVQVVLSRDWTLPNGKSPAGVDWSRLNNAMAFLVAQGHGGLL